MAKTPRSLPDDSDPVRQPMPERDPLDPPANTPDPPPASNGDHTSGPLSPTPEAKSDHLTGDQASADRPVDQAKTTTTYESRIQIRDAFQYPGNLKGAPAWVDRNWIGWSQDEDTLRGIEPGPCLRVPLPSGDIGICRIGDFVCRQSVTLVPGSPPDERIEVWPQESFVKMFVPSGPVSAAPGPVIDHEAGAEFNLAQNASPLTSSPGSILSSPPAA